MDHIDRRIRERLREYHSPVAEHLWHEVERNIIPEKKEKGFIFFLLGSLLIFLSVIAIYFAQNSPKNLSNDIIKSENISSNKDRLLKLANFTIPEKPKESIVLSDPILKTDESQEKLNKAPAIYDFEDNQLNPVPEVQEVTDQNQNTIREVKTENELRSVSHIAHSDLRDLMQSTSVKRKVIKSVNILPPKIKQPAFCPIIGKNGKRLRSIDIYSSVDYPLSFRSTAANEPQQPYINQRNATENSIVSFHSGVRITQPVFKNISVRLGLEYAQINERFQLIDSGAMRVQTVIDSIFAPDGTLINTIINTITESGIREVNHYNHLKYYTIPITVGIEKRLNKIELFMHAGVQLTVLSSYNGKILSPQLSPVEINSNGTGGLQPYKSNLGINLVGSLGIASPLTERLSLLIEPNFRYTLHSISLGTYPVNQKYLTLGISTGLRYNF